MPRSGGLIRLFLSAVVAAMLSYAQASQPADEALWREFGLVEKTTAKIGVVEATVYRLQDVTGAVAAWEWQRSFNSRPCTLESLCSTDGKRFVAASANYLVTLNRPLEKAQLDAFLQTLPHRHDTSLPALLTFVPRKNLVPNSARYILGPESLKSFAAPLADVKPSFDQGAEAQVADYKSATGQLLHLAIFYYPTPEMARLHYPQFKQLGGVTVKRSGVLLALVFGGANEQEAASLLSRVEYEAKVTWNDIPPPSPIKPLYQLLWNIIYLSGVLVALCFMSGLAYAGIRLYRRRFGTLEEDEAMTTLHL